MASIGLKKAKYAVVNNGNSYGSIKDLAGMISAKCTKETAEATLYYDDGVGEYVNMFVKASLSLTVADDSDDIYADLLGETKSTVSDATVLTKKSSDTAPYVGYGHIIPKMVNGTKMWKVEFFPRVKFTSCAVEAKTKGESVEFATAGLEGIAYELGTAFGTMAAGTWCKSGTYASEEAAETALEGFLTVAAPSSNG